MILYMTITGKIQFFFKIFVVTDHIIFSGGKNVILRLLKAVDFVVVVVVVVAVMNVVVVTLLVVTSHIMFTCG